MTNRICIAVACLLVAFGGVAWLARSSGGAREPVYEGKRLSEWLRAFDSANRNQAGMSVRDARRAIHASGTNAIPTLLRMLRATDSPLKLKFVDLVRKQHLISFRCTMASSLHAEAMEGFRCLGVRGEFALPELIKMSKQTPPLACQADIARLLGDLDPAAQDAIRSLRRELATNRSAAGAATNAGQNPASWNGNPIVVFRRWEARDRLRMLVESGAKATAVVPALRETLNETLNDPGGDDYWVRFALEQIDPDTTGQVLTGHHSSANSVALGNFSSEVGNSARLLAVGDWSEAVRDWFFRLRGRLLIYGPGGQLNRSRELRGNPQVCLELQDVSWGHVSFPTAVYFDYLDSLECDLRDAQGNLVPRGPEVQGSLPTAFWITVPFDGTVTCRVDSFTVASPSRPGGLTIQLGRRAWRIPVGVTNDYFLSGTFTPPTNHSNPLDYHAWAGTLKLPPVKISTRSL